MNWRLVLFPFFAMVFLLGFVMMVVGERKEEYERKEGAKQ